MFQRVGPIYQLSRAAAPWSNPPSHLGNAPRGPQISQALRLLFSAQHRQQLWGPNRRPRGPGVETAPCTTWPRFLGNVAERASRRLCTCYNTETGYNGRVRTQAFLGRRLKLPPHAAIRPSSRDRVAQRLGQRIGTPCSANACMTTMAFDSVHLLAGGWSGHIAPLG